MKDTVPWAIAGIVAGGVLHILTIFGMPLLAEKDAWTRLASLYPINTLSIDDSTKAAALPFMAPDVLHAYCPFDLSEHNVIVTAPLPEAAWSIGVSTRGGENFYVVTGADAKKADTRILIIPRNRLAQEASTEKSDEGDDQNIIVSPTTTGIIAIRAPLRGESFREQAADFLKQARCEVQKPLEPLVASVTDDTDAGVKPTLIPRKERRTRSRRAAGRENN